MSQRFYLSDFSHPLFIFLFSFIFNLSLAAQDSPWIVKTEMKVPRDQHAVCEVNGKIYAIGGDDTGTGISSPGSQVVEEYDPLTDTWTMKADMLTGRIGLSVAVVDGKIYAIGGFQSPDGKGQVGMATLEMFDPDSNLWRAKTPMPTARAAMAVGVVNGKIYTFGGVLIPEWQNTNKVEVYDPETNSWEQKDDMPLSRGQISAAVLNDKIYVMGGDNDAAISWSLNHEYDPINDSWSFKSSMPYAKGMAPASVINGKIYLFGGGEHRGADGTSTVQEYDPSTNSWKVKTPMPTARNGSGAVVFDNKIYVVGGTTEGWVYQPVATVEEYNPFIDAIADSVPSVYEYQFEPAENDDPDGFAHFMVYIPEEIDTLRGVFYILPGGSQTSIDVVIDEDYQAYAAAKDFALMGGMQIGQTWDIPLWSGGALISALKEIAAQSDHSELEFAPLLLRGYSAGASFAYNFTQWKPERVIAFAVLRGTFYAPDTIAASDASRSVPGYLIGSENDQEQRINNMTNIFETHRPLGALWAVAIEPNKDHLSEFPVETMRSFFDAVIPMRLASQFPADTIPQLIKLDEEKGWLGNRDNFNIAGYPEYTWDKNQACWFPNQKIAQEWQHLVTDIQVNNPGFPQKIGLFQNYPNPFNPKTNIEYRIANIDHVKLSIYNLLGQKVATLVNKKQPAGSYKVEWHATGFASGIYLYRLETQNGYIQTKKLVLLK